MNKKYSIKLNNKIKYLLLLVGIVFAVTITIPTLSRYKNRTSYYQIVEWDGTIATSYRNGSGSVDDPYIIGNANEFAFFIENLKTTNYAGNYFKLANDIIINKGRFLYDGDVISYETEDAVYDLNNYNINKLSMIESFNGHLDGNSFRIYGLYIEGDSDELSLFKNLNGNISNLYIENSVINGGYISSGLAINAPNTTIKNVLYDGYVIGKKDYYTKEHVLNDVTGVKNGTIDLSHITINGNIISLTLSGIYTKVGNINEFSINNTLINEGEFSLDLGTVKENLIYKGKGGGSVELTNLKYTVVSDISESSGLIINSNNTNIENVASYVDVYSKSIASGLVYNATNSLVLKNSYNKGSLNANITSGLINNINGVSNIINTYNAGTLNSTESYSFINNINAGGQANITNSFATTGDYAINNINTSSNATVNNSYIIHDNSVKNSTSNISFNKTLETNLKDTTFLKNTLSFQEYNSQLNNDSAWIINDGDFPILYIDDLTNSIARINISMFSWNNLTSDLNTLKFSNKFMFNITSGKELSNIQSIYYYIHNDTTPLSEEQLDTIQWNNFDNIVEVNEIGNYIVYAKVIDNDNNIHYINTDILKIDLNESIINVTINDKTFNSLTTVSDRLYVSDDIKPIVTINEEYTKLSNVYYYLSSNELEQNALETLESSVWNKYEDFTFDSNEAKIIYFRVKDNTGYYTYINTDYIVLIGYTQSDLTVGRNIFTGNNINITKDSSIKFNMSFSEIFDFKEGYKHVIVSNTKLPKDTNFTLIENKTNKVYTYKLTDSDYGYDLNNISTYELSNFIEVGKGENHNYFNDSNYNGAINEDMTIIVDFKDTNIVDNYNDINIHMRIIDDSNNIIIKTLENTIKSFNLYSTYDSSNVNSNIELISSYDKTINYNQDYLNEIPFEIKVNHFNFNNNLIYDSSLEDMKYGLEIRLFNKTTQTTMDKSYLNSVRFLVDNVSYHPNNSGIININLNDKNNGNLNIETYYNNFKIEDSEYEFRLCPYVSLDGVNYGQIQESNCKSIPLIMNSNEKKEFNFDVKMDSNNRIINKNGIQTLKFDILQMSNLDNPNVRVSLYEKRDLTAYNQNYNRLEIINYIDLGHELFSESSVYALKNAIYNSEYYHFDLLLDTDKLNYNGYKLVFELYDNEKLITTLEEKFIVKRGNE